MGVIDASDAGPSISRLPDLGSTEYTGKADGATAAKARSKERYATEKVWQKSQLNALVDAKIAREKQQRDRGNLTLQLAA